MGPGSLGALQYRNSLAGANEKLGRLAQAIGLYEQNVADAERLGVHDYSQAVAGLLLAVAPGDCRLLQRVVAPNCRLATLGYSN